MPAVATPAIRSAPLYSCFAIAANPCLICVLICGKDRVFLLSQYMGEFHPAAHLKGLSGCKIIAFICNKDLAICLAILIS